MSYYCGKSKKKNNFSISEINYLENRTNFNLDEIKDLRNRFYTITNANGRLNKDEFKENMGILGLESAFLLAERVFEIMDSDRCGSEFVIYMDVLLNGSDEKKQELSYRMIDYQNKGFFEKNDLSELILSTVKAWSSLTGNNISEVFAVKIKNYINYIFSKMQRDNKQYITKEDYLFIIKMEPELLEVFDFLNQSGNHIFLHENIEMMEKEKNINGKMSKLENQIRFLSNFIRTNYFKGPIDIQNQIPKIETKEFNPIFHMKSLTEENIKAPPLNNAKTLKNSSPKLQFLNLDDMKHDSKMIKSKTPRDSQNFIKLKTAEKNFEKLITNVVMVNDTLLKKSRSGQLEKDSSPQNHFKESGYVHQIIIKEDSIDEFDYVSNRNTYSPNFAQSHIVDSCDMDLNLISNQAIFKKEDKNKFTINLLKDINDTSKELKNELGKIFHQKQDSQKNKKKEKEKDNKELLSPMKLTRTTTYAVHNVHKSVVIKSKSNSLRKTDNERRKSKNYVFLGHQNWNLVLNMMLGIQIAVKSAISIGEFTPEKKDFKSKYYFELVPRRSNNDKKSTQLKICKFFDYAPLVFDELRTLNGISKEEYLRSIGPENLLANLLKGNLNGFRELVSSGKSGSFFYYSADGKFTLKTIHRAEFHLIKQILPSYYKHIAENPNTLIVKFFGLHKMRVHLKKSLRREKIYFIIMSNVFQTPKEINIRYDIKGSQYKRFTKENDPSIAKKDMNAIIDGFKLFLNEDKAKKLANQIQLDTKFFEENHLIDYSLLIGVHFINKPKDESFVIEENPSYLPRESINNTNFMGNGIISSDREKIYYLGIIDILTCFNLKKKIEYGFKYSFVSRKISAIPPNQYSKRFLAFIDNLIDCKETMSPP